MLHYSKVKFKVYNHGGHNVMPTVQKAHGLPWYAGTVDVIDVSINPVAVYS